MALITARVTVGSAGRNVGDCVLVDDATANVQQLIAAGWLLPSACTPGSTIPSIAGTRMTDLADVAGTAAVGTAPVEDGSGYFRLTDIATQAELDALRTSTRTVAAQVLGQLEAVRFEPVTDLSTDAPTITFGTAATITARQISPNTGNVRLTGSARTWDAVNDRQPVAFSPGLDFYHVGPGNAVEIALLPNITGPLPILVYIDGKPMTIDSDSISVSSVTPVPTYIKLAWAGTKRRHIEFFWDALGGSAYYVACGIGDTITPGAKRPLFGTSGDSFWSSAAPYNNLQAADFLASRKLGMDSVSPSYGGSGWTVGGTFGIKFGDASRITDMLNVGIPDLLGFQGSVNDDPTDPAVIQAAVTAGLAAYAAAFPNTPVIGWAPQPTDVTNTISAARAANAAAVKAAFLAAPNVIAFHDLIGTAAGVPAAYSPQVYAHGTFVTFRGAVWQMLNAGVSVNPGSPQNSRRWREVTRGAFGTGKVGSTTGDGPRDTMLYSDGVHPMPEQQRIWAEDITADVFADLRNWAAGGSIRVT